MADQKHVIVECGTIDPTYKGVAYPTLEAVYLQTPEEEAEYAPIMADLLANGLDTQGTKISGI